MILYIK